MLTHSRWLLNQTIAWFAGFHVKEYPALKDLGEGRKTVKIIWKILSFFHLRDRCERCHGTKGGVWGNECLVGGEILCDYCHAFDLEHKQ